MTKSTIVHTEHGKSSSVDVSKSSPPLDGTWYTARDRDSGKIVSQSRDRSYVVDRAKEKTGNK